MIGNVDDPRVAVAVGSVFSGTATDMRERGQRSQERSRDGELPMSEPSMTDILVDELHKALRKQLDRRLEELHRLGINLSIEYSVCKVPGESSHGADLGIRVVIEDDGYAIVKGCLVQCKRMYGPSGRPTFDELPDRGDEQARKMLRLTPASFFMLYNFLPQADLIRMAGVPASMLCPASGERIAERHADRLDSCAFWEEDQLWDLGIAMLPASRILGLSSAASRLGRPFPTDAPTILRSAWPFGVFMSDLLGACLVGDPREELVRLVTPENKRKALYATAGLTSDDPFEGFAVRHILDVGVRNSYDPQRR